MSVDTTYSIFIVTLLLEYYTIVAFRTVLVYSYYNTFIITNYFIIFIKFIVYKCINILCTIHYIYNIYIQLLSPCKLVVQV